MPPLHNGWMRLLFHFALPDNDFSFIPSLLFVWLQKFQKLEIRFCQSLVYRKVQRHVICFWWGSSKQTNYYTLINTILHIYFMILNLRQIQMKIDFLCAQRSCLSNMFEEFWVVLRLQKIIFKKNDNVLCETWCS